MINIIIIVVALFLLIKVDISLGLKFVICILLFLFISYSFSNKDKKIETNKISQFKFIFNNRVLKSNQEKNDPIYFIFGGFVLFA